MQSPEVYRLDFTDEGDQSGDQEVLECVSDDNETENRVSEIKKVVKNTKDSDRSDKSDQNECNKEKSLQQITCDSSAINTTSMSSKVKSKEILAGSQTESKKKDDSQIKRKGTKSKDIWTDSNSSARKKRDITKTGIKSNSSKSGKGDSQGVETDNIGRKMSPAFSKALKEVCFNVPKDNRIILEVVITFM